MQRTTRGYEWILVAAALGGAVDALGPELAAQVARLKSSAVTAVRGLPPSRLTVSSPSAWAGMEVVLSGDLTGVSQVRVLAGCTAVPGGPPSCNPALAPIVVTPREVTAASLKFSLPPIPGAGDGTPVLVEAANRYGAAVTETAMALDARAVITGVDNPLVQDGRSFVVRGRNLNRIKSATISPAQPVRQQKRALALGTTTSVGLYVGINPDGSSLNLQAPTGCDASGYLVLQDQPPASWPGVGAAGVVVSVSSQQAAPTSLEVRCFSMPTITATTPQVVLAGGQVTLTGTGFRSVTGVTIGLGPAGTQGVVVPFVAESPTALKLTMPPAVVLAGSSSWTQIGFILATPSTPVIGGVVYMVRAPQITEVEGWPVPNGVAVDAGAQVVVKGSGLWAPVGQLRPRFAMGGIAVPVTTMPTSSNTSGIDRIVVTMPANAPSGVLSAQTDAGATQTTFAVQVLNGPTVIQTIQPATLTPGANFTIAGINLARVSEVCLLVNGQPAAGSVAITQRGNDRLEATLRPATGVKGSVLVTPYFGAAGPFNAAGCQQAGALITIQ